jgi:hypothetical protein
MYKQSVRPNKYLMILKKNRLKAEQEKVQSGREGLD